jgi:hypothetical protein
VRDTPPSAIIPCPLCEHPARVIDESARRDWLLIEGCPCERFRVWADLVANARLKRMSRSERERIRAWVRDVRGLQREAWLVTDNDLLTGRLVVSTEQRDPPRRRRTDGA